MSELRYALHVPFSWSADTSSDKKVVLRIDGTTQVKLDAHHKKLHKMKVTSLFLFLLLLSPFAQSQTATKDGFYTAMQVPGLVYGLGFDKSSKETKWGAKSMWWGIPVTFRKNNWLCELYGAYADGILINTMGGHSIDISDKCWLEFMVGYVNYITFNENQHPTGFYSVPATLARVQIGLFYVESQYQFRTNQESRTLFTFGFRGNLLKAD